MFGCVSLGKSELTSTALVEIERPARRKPGRPSIYSEAIATEICNRIMVGESLKAICRDAHIPDITTILNWLLRPAPNEFVLRYKKAREMQAESFVDEIVDIADDAHGDHEIRIKPDGTYYVHVNAEGVNRARLRIQTRQWAAGRLAPAKYGDKIETTHIGDGTSNTTIVNNMTVNRFDERVKQITDDI